MRFGTLFVVLIGFLAGCAGGPVGYGGSNKVLHKDEKIITIQYDALVESYRDVAQIAANHCAQYDAGIKVQNVQSSSSSFGLVKTYTFECEREPQVQNYRDELREIQESMSCNEGARIVKKTPESVQWELNCGDGEKLEVRCFDDDCYLR